MPEQYTIGTLAKQAGVNVETIRYYQRRGLVGEPDRPLGGVRRYAEAHARRLRFIKQAQTLGFSLDEVTDLLTLEDGRHCREAEQLGARKLAWCGIGWRSCAESKKRLPRWSISVIATRAKCAARSSPRWKITGRHQCDLPGN